MMRFARETIWLAVALTGMSLLLSPARAQSATNVLVWRTADDRVDADIHDWSLKTLLEQVATRTGWKVFVEPDLRQIVSTKFKDLTPGEALRRLLDRLNFTLLPQTNAPAHLFVFRTSMQDATQAVRALDGESTNSIHAKVVANELIVRVKPGTDIEALARALGAKVIGKIDGLNAYRLQFKDAAATELARNALGSNSSVTGVDSNYVYDRPPTTRDVLSTSLSPLQLRAKASADGQTIIGLIDTAVQKLDGSLNDFLLPTVNIAGESATQTDGPTHGTTMAETILRGLKATVGENSSTKIQPYDVYGPNDTATTFDVAMAVYRAVNDDEATILNLSLGGSGDSQILRDLILQASQQGVLIYVAAGNTPTTEKTFPAANEGATAVTAGMRLRGSASSTTTQSWRIEDWANRGDFVDIIAPGDAVALYNGQLYHVTGTSAATALVSGAAAGAKENGAKSAAEVQAALSKMFGVISSTKP